MVKYLTKEGLEKLKKELERLKTVERKEVVKRIKSSAAHGDLKENAGYHAAKEDQAFIEGRISELQATINQAKVIEKKEKNEIQIGSFVFLESEGEKAKYQVVESEEADISEDKVSLKSPLGEALLGKKKGDIVKFHTPAGIKEYKIINLE